MITAILNGYNRPQNIPKQIEALKNQTISPTEIMLWYNQGDKEQYQVDPSIKAVYCNYNFKFHGRFAFALLAKTKYVAIFDDDTVPGKRWFENCLNTMKTHPGILGTTGVILKSNQYHPYQKVGWNSLKSNMPIEVDLVGHAWFLEKDVLRYLWYEDPISWENGEDMQLSYLAQKYGNVKTYVPPHLESRKEFWGSIRGRELGSDEQANYRKVNNHLEIRNMVAKEQIKRGWKLVKDKR